MTNVLLFPNKVFREWGAVAQALAGYLSSLGATTYEARDIIDRLQVKWARQGVPLTRPILRQVPTSPRGQPEYGNSIGIKFHTRDMPRNPASDGAWSLFELAKLDYDRSKTR